MNRDYPSDVHETNQQSGPVPADSRRDATLSAMRAAALGRRRRRHAAQAISVLGLVGILTIWFARSSPAPAPTPTAHHTPDTQALSPTHSAHVAKDAPPPMATKPVKKRPAVDPMFASMLIEGDPLAVERIVDDDQLRAAVKQAGLGSLARIGDQWRILKPSFADAAN
jgi:hypothetical protein